jgi:hypothetical protein
MIVESHFRLGQLDRRHASRVLITADDGTPLVAVVRVGDSYTVMLASEPGFDAALGMFGLSREDAPEVDTVHLPDAGKISPAHLG